MGDDEEMPTGSWEDNSVCTKTIKSGSRGEYTHTGARVYAIKKQSRRLVLDSPCNNEDCESHNRASLFPGSTIRKRDDKMEMAENTAEAFSGFYLKCLRV